MLVETRHDFHRSAYATLLERVPLASIAKFFARFPIETETQRLDGVDLLKWLWAPGKSIPLSWNYEVANAYEDFLAREDLYPQSEFMTRVMRRVDQSTYIPGDVVLRWVYPKLRDLYNDQDAYEIYYRILTLFVESYLPNHVCKRIHQLDQANGILSYVLFTTNHVNQDSLPMNFDWMGGPQLKAGPRVINLEPFSEIEYLTDARTLETILPEIPLTHRENGLWHEGRRVATAIPLHRHLKPLGISPDHFPEPHRMVLVAEESLWSPHRKRNVIYAGCAYGAGHYLVSLFHRPQALNAKPLLQPAIEDINQDENLFGREIEAKHQQLIELLTRHEKWIFHPSNDSVSLNGEHAIKGVPAKILKYFLDEWKQTRRTHFDYIELLRRPEITLGQKDPNLTTPLLRLIERIQERSQCLTIQRVGKGQFEIHIAGHIEFETEETKLRFGLRTSV